MITDKEMKDRVKKVKAMFKARNSTLRVLGYHLNGDTTPKISTQCTSCGAVHLRGIVYWTKYNCWCTRSAAISKSSLATDKFIRLAKKRHPTAKVLGEFKGFNAKIKVKCLTCDVVWEPWAGNFAKGHGCRACATLKRGEECFEKHGVYSYGGTPKAVAARKKTMLARYGREHALQNKAIFDAMLIASSKLKAYTLGKRKVHVQGYEPQGLDFILSKGIQPKDLECGVRNPKIPSVSYTYKGKARVYHPDIFLPKQNRLFEVKSDHTYVADLKRNVAKQRACLEAGYKFTFLVMSKSGERIDHRNL